MFDLLTLMAHEGYRFFGPLCKLIFIRQTDGTIIETQRNINIAKAAITSNVHTGKHYITELLHFSG